MLRKMSLKDIIINYPETKSVFENIGIKGLDNNEVLEILKNITLEEAIKMKNLDIDAIEKRLEEFVNEKNEIDSQSKINVLGLLPCPVRIPLLESFEKFLKESNLNINYELKAASAGLSWLKDTVISKGKIEELADIFISAGFDLFFEKELMGKFKEQGIFKDITGIEKYNKEFEELKDPDGDYSILGVVPAIFLVNTELLGERKMPESWKDILSDEFKNSVSLPVADFDLFNAILVNIYKNFGKEGIERLGKNFMESMHPAQMVGSNGPVITIMPYFFSKMIKENGPMKAVWPKEGAIISPIFMLTKKEKKSELEKIAKYMSGKEVGEILSHQGLFPSVNPNVKNFTTDKPMMWVGWDYIKENNIGNIIKECEKIFIEGVNNK